MNEDEDLSLYLESSAQHPPTDSIYPIQTPYADLNGLTPPPEDFEHLLKECRSLGSHNHYNLSTEPPTPPRTEADPSPARSSRSGGSSPTKLERYSRETSPLSLGSDAVMENDMDYGLGTDILQQNTFTDLRSRDSDHEADDMLGDADMLTSFFDFNSAASSPKPPPNPLIPHHQQQPPQFHTAFKPPPFQISPAPTRQISPNLGHGITRKRSRSRDESGVLDDSGLDVGFPVNNKEISQAVDVKLEFPTGIQPANQRFGNSSSFSFRALSPHQFSSNQSLQPSFAPPPQGPHLNAGMNASGSGFQPRYRLEVDFPKHLKNHPDGRPHHVKSRVETQIAVRFIMYDVSNTIKKIRLPRHAISKIKYIEDGHLLPQPETLDLSSVLVCSSAMATRHQLERALCEARGDPVPDWVTKAQDEMIAKDAADRRSEGNPDGNSNGTTGVRSEAKQEVDFGKPLYGAPVQICDQCMNRERKRAGRKKNKKPEEEEKWAQDENLRIIVFNTNQCRAFEPLVMPGAQSAIAADTHMRICCYCRHHHEKLGFRVIFTLKDHTGAVVAQTISSTIVITDDHKNTASPMPSQSSAQFHTDGPDKIAMMDMPQTPNHLHTVFMQSSLMVSPVQEMPPGYSSQGYHVKSQANGHANGQANGHSGSNPHSPPSPSIRSSVSPGAHQAKRRRSSKVPAELAMTPSDPGQFQPQFNQTSLSFSQQNPANVRASWINGHSMTQMQPAGEESYFQGWSAGENGFNPPASNPNAHPLFFAGQRPTMLPSKSPRQQQEGTLPQISKVVPAEGPVRGGIEVTVLGADFVPGLTVMFGSIPASETYFYSETTLLCRLPATSTPGVVPISVKNIESPKHINTPLFNYVDDIDKELMALALTVVGLKMKGKGEMTTSKQIALKILSENGLGKDFINRNRDDEMSQSDLEVTLLTCLDVIDMDESPHPAVLGQRNKSGQTMLHLASMLGMPKFVAALLARGVNVNSRDKNGYTPLHFAALHKKSGVVRRLLMNRADPGIRTRGGETAADLGESDQIVRATRSVHQVHSQQHSRSSSVSSESRFGRSRSSSSVSLIGPLSASMMRDSVDNFYASGNEDSSEGGEDSRAIQTWASRKGSMQDLPSAMKAALPEPMMEKPAVKTAAALESMVGAQGLLSPPAVMAAWMDAWREQLTQRFQDLQLNMPTIPAAVDYQTLFQNHMAKFQNPMPKWNSPKAEASQRRGVGTEYKWSELFNPPLPPAYDELFPDGNGFGGEPPEKIEPVEGVRVQEPSSSATKACSRSSSPSIHDLQEIHRKIARGDRNITEAQQAELRAHIAKLKRIQSDRRLYFFWIPILILILALVAFGHAPQVWATVKQKTHFVKQAVQPLGDRLRPALPGIPG